MVGGLYSGHGRKFFKNLSVDKPSSTLAIHRFEGSVEASFESPTPANILNICFNQFLLSPLTQLLVASLYWTFSCDYKKRQAFEAVFESLKKDALPAEDACDVVVRAAKLPDDTRSIIAEYIASHPY